MYRCEILSDILLFAFKYFHMNFSPQSICFFVNIFYFVVKKIILGY